MPVPTRFVWSASRADPVHRGAYLDPEGDGMRRPDRVPRAEDPSETEGARYVTGLAHDETQGARLRREEAVSVQARAHGGPDAELELEASTAEPRPVEDLVADLDAVEHLPDAARTIGSDPDADVQGRHGDETRDWYGDPRYDPGEPRMDDGGVRTHTRRRTPPR